MLRLLYVSLIRLHPRYFRQRFAEEMLEIFEEVCGPWAVASLFADAFASLFRQWVLRQEFRQPLPASADITIFRTSPRLVPLDHSSFTGDQLNTVVKFEREPEDPWREIASMYFKLIPVLGALDTDQDLIISPWEIAAAPAALRRLDKNHDGKLSAEECGFSLSADPEAVFDPEFVKHARLDFMRANPVLAALDANHDGEISEVEIVTSPAALKRLDKNGDGSLTPEEVLPDLVANQAALIFSRLDTNRDGKISGAELDSDEARPLRNLLESADRNHDGATTGEELIKELRLRQAQRRQFENATRTGGFGRSSGTQHLP